MFFKESLPRKVFVVFNYCFITLACLFCLFPVWNTLMVSFSSSEAAAGGMVTLWPIGAQLDAYEYAMRDTQFFRSFEISVIRTILGVFISMFITILAGYPLSKPKSIFPKRDVYMWMFIFTMLFNGGMIPTFLVVNGTGLLNTIWALVIPGAVSVYNIILMQNYFKSLPDALYDASRIDGANEWRTLFQIFLPLAKPVLATLMVFTTVGHWNAWFDGMLYINFTEKYPLQTYLRTIVVDIDTSTYEDISHGFDIVTQNNRAALIFIALVPILCIYPFMQKYFTKGIILGSVKG